MKKLSAIALSVMLLLTAAATVLVDVTPIAFEAYNIGGNNYFKLRDIAMAFAGKDDEFSVSWSPHDNAIVLERKEKYIPVGGELAAGDETDKMAILSSASVLEPMGAASGRSLRFIILMEITILSCGI